MSPIPEKVINKIKRLMAFNPENATEQEVANATAAIQKLLLKHQLTLADIDNKDPGEDIFEDDVDAGVAILRTWHYALIQALVPNFDCTYFIWTYGYGRQMKSGTVATSMKGYRVFRIIGHDSDVETVKWLFSYLSDTLFLMAKRQAKQRGITGGRVQQYANSFIQSASEVIGMRLVEQRKPVEELTIEESKCQVLVHVKKDKVERWKNDQYPNLTKSKIRYSNESAMGQVDGKKAGARVSLNRPIAD